MSTATWTQTHTAFPETGCMAKVYSLGNLDVLQARNLERGAEGWVFRFRGAFLTETHRGFRTMAAAKAAAVAYSTSPVSEAHAAADAYRA